MLQHQGAAQEVVYGGTHNVSQQPDYIQEGGVTRVSAPIMTVPS